jgi:UDP-N-acetylglucosamine pyrophosphorylase
MNKSQSNLDLFHLKMKSENINDNAISFFDYSYNEFLEGRSSIINENMIEDVKDIISFEKDIKNNLKIDEKILEQVIVLKLNGGLGTSMGLDKAKSLLRVKDDLNFLDLISLQIKDLKDKFKSNINFLLMNSFNTDKDTIEYISNKYSFLGNKEKISFIQNKIPKINEKTLKPVEWLQNPNLEWCPPGHGDIYTSLYSSGNLEKLLSKGIKYMFVSNSDNLGATLDIEILSYFANKNIPFMMECCQRTESDKKGGHLAIRKDDNQLILREIAQCSKEDIHNFENINKHQYFNTNNLWIRLDILKDYMDNNKNIIKLPVIMNKKKVDPLDPKSTDVIQLETAMGSAIECLKNSSAILVSRERFSPVKKCSDLFLLRSDAYIIDSYNRIVLNPKCNGKQPIIELDNRYYKFLQDLEKYISEGIPSLVDCSSLKITGKISFSSDCIIKGNVEIVNIFNEERKLPPGIYENIKIDL